MNEDFKHLRTIKIKGFGDCEDLVVAKANSRGVELALLNESGKIFIETVTPKTKKLKARHFRKIRFARYLTSSYLNIFSYDDTRKFNRGAEGLHLIPLKMHSTLLKKKLR